MQPLSAMPFYYLDNFRVMLETLRARDADVLAPQELEFMDHFSRLEKSSQALLVRMIMRKGPLFRADRLRYAEIGDTGAAIQPLIDRGWVEDKPTLTLADVFRLFGKADVAAYLGLDARRAKESKAALWRVCKRGSASRRSTSGARRRWARSMGSRSARSAIDSCSCSSVIFDRISPNSCWPIWGVSLRNDVAAGSVAAFSKPMSRG
jgi:hypothetical protein